MSYYDYLEKKKRENGYEDYLDRQRKQKILRGEDSFLDDYNEFINKDFYNKIDKFIESKSRNNIDIALDYKEQLIQRASQRTELKDTLDIYIKEFKYIYGDAKIKKIQSNLVSIKSKINGQLKELDKIIEDNEKSTTTETQTSSILTTSAESSSSHNSYNFFNTTTLTISIVTVCVVIAIAIIIAFRRKIYKLLKVGAEKIKNFFTNTIVITILCYAIACLIYGLVNATAIALGYTSSGIVGLIIFAISIVIAKKVSDIYKNNRK
jgi:hypothetical protein